jgi:hypothetical protein
VLSGCLSVARHQTSFSSLMLMMLLLLLYRCCCWDCH